MEHSFNIYIAKKYGVNSAVLLKNIYFWIEKNRANEKNFYDGYYWTYNSKKAFADLFPYMNARQIDYALKKLIDDEIIITGNYNKMAYDRTLWYAITKKGYSILQNCEMEETKKRNGNDEIDEPIPDKNTNKKQTNINTDDKGKDIDTPTPPEKKKFKVGTYENVLISNEEITKLVDTYGEQDTKEAIEFLSEEIEFKQYKAKSHYLAIRRWVVDAIREKRVKQQELAQREQRAKEIEAKKKENESKYMFNGKRISDLSQAEYEEYLKDQNAKQPAVPMYNWLEPHKNKKEINALKFDMRTYSKEETEALFDNLDEIEI